MADEEYETTESAASDTRPAQCSTLRKGGHVVIKGHPCKIVDMSTSKTGKHGHAKVHLVALDIFTGKKYEDLCPSTHNMSVPEVSRNDYQMIDIEEGFLSLMDETGDVRSDIRVPDNDIGKEIKAKHEADGDYLVTILKAMGTEAAIAVKMMSK